MSTRRDADALVCFVSKYFLDQAAPVPCPALAGSCTAVAVPGEKSTHVRACLDVEAEVEAEAETEHSIGAASSSVCLPHPPLGLQGLRGLKGVPDPLQFRTFVKDQEGVGEVRGETKVQNVAAGNSPAQRRVGGEGSDGEGGGGGRGTGEGVAEGVVQEIYVYPIKSCAGYACPGDGGWPLTSTGLLYDRCVLFCFFFIEILLYFCWLAFFWDRTGVRQVGTDEFFFFNYLNSIRSLHTKALTQLHASGHVRVRVCREVHTRTHVCCVCVCVCEFVCVCCVCVRVCGCVYTHC
jgi:hypothetical protein